jgi:hypothetical protein
MMDIKIQEVNKTLIRGNKLEVCKHIIGFDANALFLWAIMQNASAKWRVHIHVKYAEYSSTIPWYTLQYHHPTIMHIEIQA